MHTTQELRNLTEKELHNELHKFRIELHKTRLGVKTRQLKAHHKLSDVKRYIARVLTILNELREKNAADAALKTPLKQAT